MAIRPYEDWLSIPSSIEHPNHYELLGIAQFDDNGEHLQAAYEHRYTQIRQFEVGHYADEATRLLREVTEAFHCLSDPARKRAYDEELRNESERPTLCEAVDARETTADVAALPAAVEPSQAAPFVGAASAAAFDTASLPASRAPLEPRGRAAARRRPLATGQFAPQFVVAGIAGALIGGLLLVGGGMVVARMFTGGAGETASTKTAVERTKADQAGEPAGLASVPAESDSAQPAAASAPAPFVQSGVLRKVIVQPLADGGVHLLVVPPGGAPFEAFIPDARFGLELADIAAEVELGSAGPVIEITGHATAANDVAAVFPEATSVVQAARVQASIGTAVVGGRRTEFAVPIDQLERLHQLRIVDQPVEFSARLRLSPLPPHDALAEVHGRQYLIELPESWPARIAAGSPGELLRLVAANTGSFAIRDGREVPVLRGIDLLSGSGEPLASETETPTDVTSKTPPPDRVTPEPVPPSQAVPVLSDTVDLPPISVTSVQSLGRLPWPVESIVKMAMDTRFVDLPEGAQLLLEPEKPNRWFVSLDDASRQPSQQRVAGLAILENELKFLWLQPAVEHGTQLRNCRLRLAEGSRQHIVALRNPIRAAAMALPKKSDECKLDLPIGDAPSRGKLLLEAVVEYRGSPVDPRATGQQLSFGRSREFGFDSVDALGELAEYVRTQVRLGGSDSGLMVSVIPCFDCPPYDHELTDEGLSTSEDAVERSYVNALQNLQKAQAKLAEVRNKAGAANARAAAMRSQQNAIAKANEDLLRARNYGRSIVPQLAGLADALRSNVQIRFRVIAASEDTTIVLYDAGYDAAGAPGLVERAR